MADWRKDPLKCCPCCKAPGRVVVCSACGYLYSGLDAQELYTVARGKGRVPLSHYFPRPAAMSSDEHALRLSLWSVFLTSAASDYLGRLREFADWLQENDRREEAAARADWEKHLNRSKDPRGWWRWAAAGHPDWWRPDPSGRLRRAAIEQEVSWVGIPGLRRAAKDRSRALAGIRNQQHSSRWFLGWPPGWVKFTQPADETGRWWVTVIDRSLTYSHAYELSHPEGYTRLFHPVAAATPPLFDAPTGDGLFSEV